MQLPKIICLMGPTASGKTDLALELAKQFPLEIISVDSALVYKGMDIGTAKPNPEILTAIPHHLIDIRDPTEAYSAADFRRDALELITMIHARNKVPLLVGGTMLYFKALLKGLAELPSANEKIRQEIMLRAQEKGWQTLHDELKTYDPDAAARIHPNDTQRIQRALEVYFATGKSLTSWQQVEMEKFPYDVLTLIITPNDRALLHKRIEKRFLNMLDNGFIEEVTTLFQRKDLSLNTPAMRAVGYRQVWEYLTKEISYEEMIQKGIAATRQYAKRQLTWLRHWPGAAEWYDSEAKDLVLQINSKVKLFLNI